MENVLTVDAPRRRGLHAARAENSKALMAILNVLSDFEFHTSSEIVRASGSVCVSTRIQELKAPVNGYEIESRRAYTSAAGASVWEYRLKGGAV
jgi:hypothetical protein